MPRPLRIDLRDQRLPGPAHRLEISAGTSSSAVRDARAAALRMLLDQGERGLVIIERLRARRIGIEEVQRAVESMDLAALDASPDEAPVGSHVVGLGATIDRYLMQVEGNHSADGTLSAYRAVCRSLEAAFGVERSDEDVVTQDVDIASIGSSAAREWLQGPKGKRKKPWSPHAQNRAHQVAGTIWDMALVEDEELSERLGSPRTLARNPWRRSGHRKGVRAAKRKATRFEFLSRAEAARLLRAMKGTPYAAYIACGIYGGLRPGEKTHLRRGIDADLEKRRVRIQTRGGRYPWRPKTERSTRDIPMHPRLARWLRLHEQLGYAGDVYIFRAPGRDQPMSTTTRERWVKNAFAAVGIQYGRRRDALTDHSLRHTFASWLTQRDVHPKKIAALMGDTVEVVMATYSHLVSEDLEEALWRL